MKQRQKLFDTSLAETLPLLLKNRSRFYSLYHCQGMKNDEGVFQFVSYKHVYARVIALALALKEHGVKRGDRVALFSDNRKEWLLSDFAIMCLGAADVPRGCDSIGIELQYILNFADCSAGIFENTAQLSKVFDSLEGSTVIAGEKLSFAIVMDSFRLDSSFDRDLKNRVESAGVSLYSFREFIDEGFKIARDNPHAKALIENEMSMTHADEIATIIFTSGTTGTPKGVMLTHRNMISQLEVMHNFLPVENGDIWLSVLPVWHSYERIFQYVAILYISCIAYSKPIAPMIFPDLQQTSASWMCGVPRLWESLALGINRSIKKRGGCYYSLYRFFLGCAKRFVRGRDLIKGDVWHTIKTWRIFDILRGLVPLVIFFTPTKIGDVLFFRHIRAKFGKEFRAGMSAGGSLPRDVELFYKSIHLPLLECYGMTETAPLLTMRKYTQSKSASVGIALPCCQIKIVAEKNGLPIESKTLGSFKTGLVFARGEQVMKGYYKKEDLTAEILSDDGWINTGDLGFLSADGDLIITGRAKDTIVLSGGENIEPVPIENALTASSFIEHAVVLGQDKKYLAALIVPHKKAIEEWAAEHNIANEFYEGLLDTPEIEQLIRDEIDRLITARTGFRSFERIFKFSLLEQSFEIGVELSAKQSLLRHKIAKKYKKNIDGLF